MLTRSIEFDDEATLEEIVFRYGKLACIGFAAIAVALGTLDLMNVGALRSASEFLHDAHFGVADMAKIPAGAVEGLRGLSARFKTSAPGEETVAVAIPRDEAVTLARAVSPSKSSAASGLLAGLAEARHLDAVETALENPVPNLLPHSAPPSDPEKAAPIQLASINPTLLPQDIPTASALPAPIQVSLPAILAVLPPPAPGVPPPSPIQRLHLDGKSLNRAQRCLANAVYFEARDQPYKGQVAVAQVVMNRVFSGFYPEDVCGVVYQNASHHLACQFTFACDGKRKVIDERSAWARANRIARETLEGKLYEKAVGTATHYHALYVHPYWTHEMRKLVRYGMHSFYRPIAWGSGADEPVWSKLALKKKN